MVYEDELKKIVFKVGAFLRKNAFNHGLINWKGEFDPVTNLDKKVEKLIRKEVLKLMNANFLGEEFGFEDNKSDITWVIDPIDGTKSFIIKEFNSSISIAILKKILFLLPVFMIL